MYLLDFRKLVFAQIFFWVIVTWTRARVVLDLVNTDGTIGWSASSAFLSDFDVFDGSADKIQLILSPRPEDMPTDGHVNYSAAAGLRSWDSVTYTAALELVKNNEVQVIPSPLRSKPSATPVSEMTTMYMIRVVPSHAKSANGTSHVFKELTMGNGSVSFLQLVPRLNSCIITEEKTIVVSAGLASITTYGISDSWSFGRALDGVEGFLSPDAVERNEWHSLDPNLYHSLSSIALDDEDEDEVESSVFQYDDEVESSIFEYDGEDADRVELPAKRELFLMNWSYHSLSLSKHDDPWADKFKGPNWAMSSRSESRHEDKNSLILVETLSWELWLLMSGCFLLLIGSAIWIHAQRRKEEMDQPVGRGDEFRNDFFRMETFDIREDAIDDDDDVIVGYGGGTGSSLAVVASTDKDGESRRWRTAFWKHWWAQIKRKTSSLVRMR